MDPIVEALVARVNATTITEDNPDAKNMLSTKVTWSETPLSFLQNKELCERKWGSKKYEKHQTDYNTAYAHAKKVIGVPSNRGMLTRCQETNPY